MAEGARVPNHDHSGFNQGGKLALSRALEVDEARALSSPPPGTDFGSVVAVTPDAATDDSLGSLAARAAHQHGIATYSSTPAAIGTGAAGTSGDAPARGSHVHATGAGTPTTQAFGDAAATGSGPAGAMTDHKHAMPTAAVTTSGLTQATGKLLGRTTASTGAIEEITVGTGLSMSAGTISGTGASALDIALWRPVLDGATGVVLQDGATGEAIMAFGPA